MIYFVDLEPIARCPLLGGAQGRLLPLRELLWGEPAAAASLPAWSCPSVPGWSWGHRSHGAAFPAGLGPAVVPGGGLDVAEPSHSPWPTRPCWVYGMGLLRDGGHRAPWHPAPHWSSPFHTRAWAGGFLMPVWK